MATVDQLRAFAKEHGIELSSSANKGEILAALGFEDEAMADRVMRASVSDDTDDADEDVTDDVEVTDDEVANAQAVLAAAGITAVSTSKNLPIVNDEGEITVTAGTKRQKIGSRSIHTDQRTGLVTMRVRARRG